MRVPNKQAVHRILLMLCVIFCVCLLLTQPVNETQSEDAGAYQGVQIPPGMTIVTVPVSDKTMPDKSLLYPGCVVGVKATWKLNKSRIPEIIPDCIVDALIKCKLIRNRGGTISRAMFGGRILVLSVKHGVRGTFVTLLVDAKQAEVLLFLLAEKNGSISLTVRKPFGELEPKQLDKNRLSPLREIDVIRGPTIKSTHSE